MGDPDFFTIRARNWGKVFGAVKNIKPDEDGYLKPEDNPRAWWVMGIIRYHQTGRDIKAPITNNDPERDYRTTQRSESVVEKKPAVETRDPVTGDIFHNAFICGFLREEDINWIKQQLGIIQYA